MDFSNIWCWLIPLLCTLLGAIFGYLLGKGSTKTIDNSADLKLLQDKNAKLQADLDACGKKVSASASLTSDLDGLRAKNVKLQADLDANAKQLTAGATLNADLDGLKAENAKLQADLDACGKKLTAATAAAAVGGVAAASSFAATAKTETLIPFDAFAAKAALGKTIKQDDLKVVEGIGPKIESMFKDAGIKTWKQLSETAVARCKEILLTGGDRYKVHDPASWPLQAKMCYEGKWAELAKWQDEHDHGKL